MEIDDILGEHAKRLHSVDALLPDTESPATAAGATRITTRGGVAYATHSVVETWSEHALWRALREYHLDVRLANDDRAAALESLLEQWESVLGQAREGDWETAAVVQRPSRDTVGADVLLRHGFAPARVLAVRPADRLGSGPPAVPGVAIRQAEPRDRDTVVEMSAELHRFDAQFGVVTVREGKRELLRRQTEELLDAPTPSLFIAELYGRPLGFVHAQLPPASNWIAGHTSADRVGYLASLHVDEEARSSGVGTALAAHAHQVFDEEGVEAVLLHHAVANPRSAPFWYAQGYRPLWTTWYRRPARRAAGA